MNTQSILATQDLKKSFAVGENLIEVLKGINVTIKKGEFVIIFGPSGCGKSTLLHCLLGLEAPTSGKVMVDSDDFYTKSEDERALYRRNHVGMIYQQPLWVGSFNVIENVSFPLHLLDIDEATIYQKAMESLAHVGLEKWATYKPTELSSGQQQKISLARALMTDPELIVADEPTGNLDTVSGQELLNTFVGLVAQEKSIVMVTHDLEYLKYGTKIIHMLDGSVVEEFERSKDKILKDFASKKTMQGEVVGINVRDPELLKKMTL